MRNRNGGVSLVELLVGVAILGGLALLLSSFFKQTITANKQIERALGFEQAVDLVRQSLTDKSNCKVDFWSYAGSPTRSPNLLAVANDFANVVPGSPAGLTPYTNIDAIVNKPVDPFAVPLPPRVPIIKTGMTLEGNLKVESITVTPANAASKFVKQVSEDRYLELVNLTIIASEPAPSTKKKTFQMITNIEFSNLTGVIDPCYQAMPQIESRSASRAAYMLQKPVSCDTLGALPKIYYYDALGTTMHPHYKFWCENYGPPAGSLANVSAKIAGGDPACVSIPKPTFRTSYSYVKKFNQTVPNRPTSVPPLPFLDPLFVPGAEGRCPLTFDTPPVGEDGTYTFTLSHVFDHNASTLALGCNESRGWSVTSCSIASDGKGGALAIAIEPEPSPSTLPTNFCVFKELNKPAASGFDITLVVLSVVCSKVTQ